MGAWVNGPVAAEEGGVEWVAPYAETPTISCWRGGWVGGLGGGGEGGLIELLDSMGGWVGGWEERT